MKKSEKYLLILGIFGISMLMPIDKTKVRKQVDLNVVEFFDALNAEESIVQEEYDDYNEIYTDDYDEAYTEEYDYRDYDAYQYSSVLDFPEIVSPWSFGFLDTYIIDYRKIPELDDMINKANEIMEICPDVDTSYIKVKEERSWGKSYYTQTKNDSGLYYAGDIKNGRPNGVGMLVDVIETYNYNIVRKKYVGEFKKGQITGFGLQFNNGEINSSILSQLNEIEDRVVGQLAFDDYFNPVSYIGDFENGECTGEGITLIYRDINDLLDLLDAGTTMEEMDDNNIFMSDITIVKGDHEQGTWDGDIKVYYNGKLLYDGEMEDDMPNGKGKLYYPNSDILKYEGGFKEGKYDGKGTEYTKDGAKIYSGNWKNGDYDS